MKPLFQPLTGKTSARVERVFWTSVRTSALPGAFFGFGVWRFFCQPNLNKGLNDRRYLSGSSGAAIGKGVSSRISRSTAPEGEPSR